MKGLYDPDSGSVAVIKEYTGTYSPIAGGVNFFNLGPAEVDAPNEQSGCGDNALGSGCALGTINNNTLEPYSKLIT